MSALSVSFVLGKASSAHGANIAHNNREFIADNITFVKNNIEEVYWQPSKLCGMKLRNLKNCCR
jgi:hypothetical protein